jgi:DNA-binding transcriptional LysR family regulator
MTELRQLRYFVTIADEGQMTRAAQRLHLAQPALSQAISQLEERLGVALFERHARGVSLTPAGETYLGKASAVLAALADAELTVEALARAAQQKINWGFISSPPMVDAPELFAQFRQAHPDGEASFRELSYPRISTAAWLREVDLALCYTPTPHPEVSIVPVRSEPRVILMSEDHRLARRRSLSLQDVLDETFCGTDPSLEPVRVGFWQLDDHRGVPPRDITPDRATNPQETVAAVASGRCVAAAPASSSANLLRALPGMGVIARHLRDAAPTMLSLVAPTERENVNPMVDTMIRAARELASERRLTEPA